MGANLPYEMSALLDYVRMHLDSDNLRFVEDKLRFIGS